MTRNEELSLELFRLVSHIDSRMNGEVARISVSLLTRNALQTAAFVLQAKSIPIEDRVASLEQTLTELSKKHEGHTHKFIESCVESDLPSSETFGPEERR